MPERIQVGDLLRNSIYAITNRFKLLRHRRIGHVVLRVSGSYPERTATNPRRFPWSLLPWPAPPPSVEAFCWTLERLAIDPRVEGVVLVISGLSAGLATLGSLRQAVLRFRETGKRAIAYVPELSMWTCYLASACDEIAAPESASLWAAGLRAEAVFLKDTLAMVGIEADFVKVAEYKTSPDMFQRSEMSEPHRKMLEWLLNSLYEQVVAAMATGRDLAPAKVRDLLDTVPLRADQAREVGLLDAVCYEDELPARLGTEENPAVLLTWEQARRRLVRARRWNSRRSIGVISLEGTIVPGPSRQPPLPIPLPLPLPAEQAGSDTLVQQLRAAAQNKCIAAVILHIDSPGGSALASDLIWREVAHLSRSKPVVAYFGKQAASGGYYVSTAANAVVTQPAALTGSIGIWAGKIVMQGLYDRLRVTRESVSRGASAGLFSDAALFSDEERARIRRQVGAGYVQFKQRVAEGRDMTDKEVEAVARGRVWTGEQALERGLVDQLGDLRAAVKRARDLAGLDARRYVPVVNLAAPRRYMAPTPFQYDDGQWFDGIAALLREKCYALAPWAVQIRE
jgi:protease-4